MTEQIKGKRALFPSGEQRAFLEQVSRKFDTSDIARLCKCSERAVRDWRREKFSMPLTSVRTLTERACISAPKNIEIRDPYAHTSRAGKIGFATVIKTYGRIPNNEAYRQKRWRAWWESTGKFMKNPILAPKVIHTPRKSSSLAEFIGIMMGDGGISNYQIAVILHHTDDLEYTSFVIKMIQRLFKVNPSVYHSPEKSVNNIVVSRKEMVDYLQKLGLPIGNKVRQQFDIPDWIKGDRRFARACLRGLIDTDGSVFTHTYRVKGIQYAYKKLSFTSASAPLRESVHTILQELGFHSRLSKQDVRLESVTDMRRYFSVVGSHNPKHLRRYESTVG